jgi:pimeloyl-ACP methyl ester carboxylesterase
LVLIHGVAGSSRIWDPVVPELARHYEIVRIDLLGYGRSPKPHLTHTPTVHVEAIHRTLHHHGIKTPYTYQAFRSSLGSTAWYITGLTGS